MIFIGTVYGEPEQKESVIRRKISNAMRTVKKLREPFEIGDSPGVNVVFYVPGRITSPNWVGLRDGKFSRKDQFLMIQVAVPDEVVSSNHIEEFVVDSLYKANTLAEKVFHQKGIMFPIQEANKLVNRLANYLTPSGN